HAAPTLWLAGGGPWHRPARGCQLDLAMLGFAVQNLGRKSRSQETALQEAARRKSAQCDFRHTDPRASRQVAQGAQILNLDVCPTAVLLPTVIVDAIEGRSTHAYERVEKNDDFPGCGNVVELCADQCRARQAGEQHGNRP